MPEFYTDTEVVKEPFLFVSYSHKNKDVTTQMVTTLLESGVRLWYDKDLAAGDSWKEKVKELIEHPNCRGVIFVCSPEAFRSKNVHEERAHALEVQKERGTEKYTFFLVNVCENELSGLYMNLLRETFESLPADNVDNLFPVDFLRILVGIIGQDPVCVMTCKEAWCTDLLLENGIRRRASETVDKGAILLEKMHESAHFGNISITCGQFERDGISFDLRWQLVGRDKTYGIFLMENSLPNMYGGNELTEWLNDAFRKNSFTEDQDTKIVGNIRLLTFEEAKTLSSSVTKTGERWWLEDRQKNKQAWVDEDGITDTDNYAVVSRFQFSVRPVIVLDIDDAMGLSK